MSIIVFAFTYISMNEALKEQQATILEQQDKIESQSSDLEDLEEIKKEYYTVLYLLRNNKTLGQSSNQFKVDHPVIVLKKSTKTEQIELTTSWNSHVTVSVDYLGSSARLNFDEDTWYGSSTTLTVVPYKSGPTLATFSNSINSQTFSVLIIVTD